MLLGAHIEEAGHTSPNTSDDVYIFADADLFTIEIYGNFEMPVEMKLGEDGIRLVASYTSCLRAHLCFRELRCSALEAL